MTPYFNIWVVLTVALFYLGPIDWAGRQLPYVAVIVFSCLLFFNLGSWAGRQKTVNSEAADSILDRRPLLTVPIIVVYVLLVAHSIKRMTGLSIFDPSSYSLDLRKVYANFVDTVLSLPPPVGLEKYLIVAQGLTFFLVLYATCVHFNKRNAYVVLLLAPLIASSLLRGTDKELFDVIIICGVLYFYKSRSKFALWPFALVAVVIVYIFVQKRIERSGGAVPDCVFGGEVCLNRDGFLYGISPTLEFMSLIITSYVTQGYQALSMAVTMPFEPNYGGGHVPLFKSLLCNYLDVACGAGTFQEKLTEAGWEAGRRWTSVYPVLANDFNWYFTPVYFLFIGCLFGFSEKMWRVRRDVFSLQTIILVTIFFVYSSANMQLMISFEWQAVTLLTFGIQFLRLVLLSGFWRSWRAAPQAAGTTGSGPP